MFTYVALAKDKAWQPGPYEGVELMILHKHEATGGLVVLRKFKAGHTIPAHTHTRRRMNGLMCCQANGRNLVRFTLLARCSLLQKARVTVRTSRARK
jgi:hypothetical protein